MLWSLDPDVKASGLAIFDQDTRAMLWLGYVEPFKPLPPWMYQIDQLGSRHLVCEKPKIYPGVPALDANDLVDLGEVVGWFRSELKPVVYSRYYPADWKAQVKKPVHHNRLWQLLTEDEKKFFPAGTEAKITKGVQRGKYGNNQDPVFDLLDGAGIGMFHLKRTGRGASTIRR